LKTQTAGRGILFVSHEATRTGAPTNLLHFLRWFKRSSTRPFSILLGRGGELMQDFRDLADTWSLDRSPWHPGATRIRLLRMLGRPHWAKIGERKDAQQFAARCSPALVYVNSIASARVVDVLAPRVQVLTHVHETGFLLRAWRGSELSSLLDRTQQFIACSNAVRKSLVDEQNISQVRVETVHESIPVDETRPERAREQILHELNAPNDALLVVGGGNLHWVKGPDLFIQVARTVCAKHPKAHFAWVGGGPNLEIEEFRHDSRLSGVAERIHLLGHVQKSVDYLAAADLFLLTSRADSYPLICLEAAALGKPILCFAEAGGMPEFVEDDCGFVVPYLEVAAMAERVSRLLECPGCRAKMGAAARRKVTERHDISMAAPRILEIIERMVATGN
jgi:glycosyltransferase involved in cell wall biosynthesis